MIGKRALLFAAVALLLGTTAVRAQVTPPQVGSVAGSGTVTLKRRPEILRLRVEVFAEGKSVKEALANLGDRRQVVRGRLAELGVQEGSVTFGEPQVTAELQQMRQQMVAMMQAQLGDRFKKNAKGEQPEPTVVSAPLTAEWPLKGQGTEALLIEVTEIQEAVKKADIPGVPTVEKLLGAEVDQNAREQVDEIRAMVVNANEGGQTPGEPAFSLVAKLSERDRAKALAEAFRKARTAAADTARAAGAQLGEIHHLQSQVQNGGNADNANVGFDVSDLMSGVVAVASDESENLLEAVGSQPGAVVYRVIVSASFYLKPAP